jgi:hypothetical protein
MPHDGKPGKLNPSFPPFPPFLEIAPRFPHSHRCDYGYIYVGPKNPGPTSQHTWLACLKLRTSLLRFRFLLFDIIGRNIFALSLFCPIYLDESSVWPTSKSSESFLWVRKEFHRAVSASDLEIV